MRKRITGYRHPESPAAFPVRFRQLTRSAYADRASRCQPGFPLRSSSQRSWATGVCAKEELGRSSCIGFMVTLPLMRRFPAMATHTVQKEGVTCKWKTTQRRGAGGISEQEQNRSHIAGRPVFGDCHQSFTSRCSGECVSTITSEQGQKTVPFSSLHPRPLAGTLCHRRQGTLLCRTTSSKAGHLHLGTHPSFGNKTKQKPTFPNA